VTKRALALSGDGPVGIAWESGPVAGLAEGGIDVGPDAETVAALRINLMSFRLRCVAPNAGLRPERGLARELELTEFCN